MEKTKVVLAQSSSGSLRTTIPASYARTLGITAGTDVAWDLQPNGDGFALIVRVVKNDAPEPKRESRKARKRGART